MQRENLGLQLGTPVTMIGVLIGRSEFTDGPPSYLVEFEQGGKPVQAWFQATEVFEEGD